MWRKHQFANYAFVTVIQLVSVNSFCIFVRQDVLKVNVLAALLIKLDGLGRKGCVSSESVELLFWSLTLDLARLILHLKVSFNYVSWQ